MTVSETSSAEEGTEESQAIDWEQVVGRNLWYAVVLSFFIMIDEAITTRSLDVHHPFTNVIPLAIVFIGFSVVPPFNLISDSVSERFESPMGVYTMICVILGIILILV